MRRAALIVLALLLAALLGAVWYAYDKGFTKKWREFVTKEFRARGVEISLRRLKLEPFRGIVAKEVKVFDARDRRRTLAVVDEMRLVVNYANLLRGKTFLDALELRDARIAVPLDAARPRGPAIEVTKLSGRLFLPPQQIYLSYLDAELYGVRLTSSGRLINPQAVFAKPSASDRSATIALIERVVGELKALRFETGPAQLDVQFSGDLSQPGTIVVNAAFWGEKIRRNNYRLESVYIAANYRNGIAAVQQLAATDAVGVLACTASYEWQSQLAQVRLRSTLDLQGFIRAFGIAPQLEEFVFYKPPIVEGTAELKLGTAPTFSLLGSMSCERLAYRSVMFDGLAADFSWDGTRWSARNARLVHRSGTITGDVLVAPNDFRSRLRSTINPSTLAPLLTGRAADWFSQFVFDESPEIEVEAQGTAPNLESCEASGALKFGKGSYRGIPARSVTAGFRYAGRKLVIDPVQVRREEGSASGAVTFDFARNEVQLDRVKATLNPAEVILWIEPKLLKDIAPYRFANGPPHVLLDGTVHTKGGRTTDLKVNVDAAAGLDYTFLKRDLFFPKAAARLHFTEDRLQIDDLSASLFGGRLRGNADISLDRKRPVHAVDLQVENVDFASLTKLYFNYETSRGLLNGTYSFTGRGDDPRSMRGRGELTVTDGHVFAIPFLGPVSGILNNIVPGMGHDLARKASASFAIEEGVISTEDFLVEGNGFRLIGGGKLMFIDDRMNFRIRINAKGPPGVLLFPVSKLFEYVADEKLSKPRWRPKALPRL